MAREQVCDFCGPSSGGGQYYTGPGGVSRFACWASECSSKAGGEQSARHEEELASLRARGLCLFNLAYIGYCGEHGVSTYRKGERIERSPPVRAVPGTDFCDVHLGEPCSNPGCSNQAISQCTSASSLVCGAPYCKACGHCKYHWG